MSIFVLISPLISAVPVNVISTMDENGHVTCQFSFETISSQVNGEPAPIVIEKDYYITFAVGILRTEGIKLSSFSRYSNENLNNLLLLSKNK